MMEVYAACLSYCDRSAGHPAVVIDAAKKVVIKFGKSGLAAGNQ